MPARPDQQCSARSSPALTHTLTSVHTLTFEQPALPERVRRGSSPFGSWFSEGLPEALPYPTLPRAREATGRCAGSASDIHSTHNSKG